VQVACCTLSCWLGEAAALRYCPNCWRCLRLLLLLPVRSFPTCPSLPTTPCRRIIKNSFGTDSGMNGYMQISMRDSTGKLVDAPGVSAAAAAM